MEPRARGRRQCGRRRAGAAFLWGAALAGL